jgi:hypothetical protein
VTSAVRVDGPFPFTVILVDNSCSLIASRQFPFPEPEIADSCSPRRSSPIPYPDRLLAVPIPVSHPGCPHTPHILAVLVPCRELAGAARMPRPSCLRSLVESWLSLFHPRTLDVLVPLSHAGWWPRHIFHGEDRMLSPTQNQITIRQDLQLIKFDNRQ